MEADVKLALGTSSSKVIVNGVDISRHCSGIALTHFSHELPELQLLIRRPDIEISGGMKITATRDETVVDFLDSLDSDAVSAAVLQNISMAIDPIAATIEELKRIAREADGD